MTQLLKDIIASAIGSGESLPTILRKCLVLAYQLKNDRLKTWVEKELNGYGSNDELPEYRKIGAHARGHFVGPMGMQINNQPLAAAVLAPEHRQYAETANLVQPIASYDTFLGDEGNDKNSAIIPWNPNLTVLYQDKFYEAYALNRAWQEIPHSVFRALLDTVRTRVLTFALELKDELGEQADSASPNLAAVPAHVVDRMIVNNIYGGTAVFAGDAAAIQVDARQQVVAGDISSLKAALLDTGLGGDDVRQLEAALAEDSVRADPLGKIGAKTEGWLTKSAKKIGSTGLKVTESVATKVLEGIVKSYLGLPP